MKKLLFILVFWLLYFQNATAQCFEIEAIYVDACGGQEGFNEMVRFKVGSAPINTSTLSVTWPSNAWQGLIQNATTANVVAALNADVVANGGCGQILQPSGGVLPANALVYLVTGINYDVTLNSFGALMETVYILFQNNTTVTAGHFGNAGTGLRTLSMSFAACTDQVTYDRTLLVDPFGANIAADGATVLFTPSGQATYTNLGCVAPVNPFYAIANPDTITACAGSTINLTGSVAGQQSIQWSAPVGSLSNVNSLATSYTIPTTATGTITVTLTATNSCGLTTSDQVIITVTPSITPDFSTSATYCTGSSIPALVNTSPNGITGTWNPATVSNTASGSYVFTPNPNQCATSVTLNVTITNSIVPDFATSATYCTGSSIPALVNTSPNGITGTWNPATVSNTTSGSYVFTPNSNQCATPVTLNVTITNSIVPDFATLATYCTGSSIPALVNTSPNGITGTWNPATVSNTASGSYVFTPNPNQCATSVTLNVTITNSIVPDFATSATYCTGSSIPALVNTSPNGITGTWNPATVSNTASGTYVFTPNPNQCATPVTLNVTITNSIVPDFATLATYCTGSSIPALVNTSPNGITGTWNPATVSNTASGTYVFTPNPNQCATPITLNVTIYGISGTITGPSSLCAQEVDTFTVSVGGGTWQSDNTSIATIDQNGIVTAIAAGTVTINYSIPGGCTSIISTNLTVLPLPQPILSPAFICVDPTTGIALEPAVLNCGLSATTHSFSWTLDGNPLPTTSPTHLATTTGVYKVMATHLGTGCSNTTSTTVTNSSFALATASIAVDFALQQTITVTITGGSGNYVYQLNDGPWQTQPIFTGVPEGENSIGIQDLNGCGIIYVTVYSLNYPRFFTPNGDGFNDTWNISGITEQPNALIAIFDRYGKLLKTIKASEGSGWDGTYNGEPLPSTDYWFSLEYVNRNGRTETFKAHFSLKR